MLGFLRSPYFSYAADADTKRGRVTNGQGGQEASPRSRIPSTYTKKKKLEREINRPLKNVPRKEETQGALPHPNVHRASCFSVPLELVICQGFRFLLCHPLFYRLEPYLSF